MKDTINKVRALLSMKSSLIHALNADLEAALAKVEVIRDANDVLLAQNKQLIAERQIFMDLSQALDTEVWNRWIAENSPLKSPWWFDQDSDAGWVDEQLARMEAEERADEIHVDVELLTKEKRDA